MDIQFRFISDYSVQHLLTFMDGFPSNIPAASTLVHIYFEKTLNVHTQTPTRKKKRPATFMAHSNCVSVLDWGSTDHSAVASR